MSAISFDEIFKMSDKAYADGYKAGLAAAADVCRQWREHYPTNIFPPDSNSVDAQSAKFARHLCSEIQFDIQQLEPPERLPLPVPAPGGGDK